MVWGCTVSGPPLYISPDRSLNCGQKHHKHWQVSSRPRTPHSLARAPTPAAAKGWCGSRWACWLSALLSACRRSSSSRRSLLLLCWVLRSCLACWGLLLGFWPLRLLRTSLLPCNLRCLLCMRLSVTFHQVVWLCTLRLWLNLIGFGSERNRHRFDGLSLHMKMHMVSPPVVKNYFFLYNFFLVFSLHLRFRNCRCSIHRRRRRFLQFWFFSNSSIQVCCICCCLCIILIWHNCPKLYILVVRLSVSEKKKKKLQFKYSFFNTNFYLNLQILYPYFLEIFKS